LAADGGVNKYIFERKQKQMALTDESNSNGFYMPVAPAYGGGYGNGGFGGFGGDWGWIILLLLAFNGGWGGMGGFGGGQLGYDFPWLLNGQNGINNNVSDGFRSAQLSDAVTSVRDGIAGLSTQLCGCCGDLQMALANGFSGVEQGANARQMANMQTAFAGQTAMAQGFTGVNSGIADLRYTVATEACADRAAVNDALRDVIAANTASTQRILDQLCADKIEAKNDQIAQLRQQLSMADLRASQTAQNAFISQGFANEVDALYNRLNSCPVPTTPVYGRTPIFTCGGNTVGCGCNGGFVN
jgi:hypothetical protein